MIFGKSVAAKGALACTSKAALLPLLTVGLMIMSGQANAGTATFAWFNINPGGHPDAEGTLTLTSALITGPADPLEPYTFNLTASQLASVGETALGDVTDFTLTFDGHTLTKSDITNPPSNWSAQANTITSVFSASHDFSDGTLLMSNLGFGGSTQFTTPSTATSTAGEWLMQSVSPVPLPGAAWLLLSGMGFVGTFLKRRQ